VPCKVAAADVWENIFQGMGLHCADRIWNHHIYEPFAFNDPWIMS